MRNIKFIYWVLTIGFLSLTFIVTFMYVTNLDSRSSTFLSGIAVVIATIAMGLADQRLPLFNGVCKIWLPNQPQVEEEGCEEYKLSIKIENNSTIPVQDVKFKFRSPIRISSIYDDKNEYIKQVKHGRTTIFIDDTFQILGSNRQNDYLHYDFRVKLNLLGNNNIYIILSGSNVQTKTWILSNEICEGLKLTNNENTSLKM